MHKRGVSDERKAQRARKPSAPIPISGVHLFGASFWMSRRRSTLLYRDCLQMGENVGQRVEKIYAELRERHGARRPLSPDLLP